MPTMDAKVLTDEADGLDALSAALGRSRSVSGRSALVRPAPPPTPAGAPPSFVTQRPALV
jgi:hypothetical protein